MQIEGRAGVGCFASSFVIAAIATGCGNSPLIGTWKDPPFPPAQGAVVETIQPTAGGSGCVATSAEPFTAPPNVDPASGTAQTLMCDVSVPGCKPNANVVVDGDDASVQCTVSGAADSFSVTGLLKQGSFGFDVHGIVSAVGGNVLVGSQHDQNNLQDRSCDITIEPNKGQIKPGAIWAAFNCSSFGDPSSATGPGCTASGKFLFENCGK